MINDYERTLIKKRRVINIISIHHKKEKKQEANQITKDKKLNGDIDNFLRELISDKILLDNMKKMGLFDIMIYETQKGNYNHRFFLSNNGTILYNNRFDSTLEKYALTNITPYQNKDKYTTPDKMISQCIKNNKAFILMDNKKHSVPEYLAGKYFEEFSKKTINSIKMEFNMNLEKAIENKSQEIKKY